MEGGRGREREGEKERKGETGREKERERRRERARRRERERERERKSEKEREREAPKSAAELFASHLRLSGAHAHRQLSYLFLLRPGAPLAIYSRLIDGVIKRINVGAPKDPKSFCAGPIAGPFLVGARQGHALVL